MTYRSHVCLLLINVNHLQTILHIQHGIQKSLLFVKTSRKNHEVEFRSTIYFVQGTNQVHALFLFNFTLCPPLHVLKNRSLCFPSVSDGRLYSLQLYHPIPDTARLLFAGKLVSGVHVCSHVLKRYSFQERNSLKLAKYLCHLVSVLREEEKYIVAYDQIEETSPKTG